MKTTTIVLTLPEYENFRSVAERFNVKFDVKRNNETYMVKAPEEKLQQWGYLEHQNNKPEN
jgi:hypothetical protein